MTDDTIDLIAIAADVAADLDDVDRQDGADGVDYARGGVTYARLRADRLEVRLPADIGEAALRTPDTSAGEDGWIVFTPRTNERHVADRAEAWLVTAHRHARDEG